MFKHCIFAACITTILRKEPISCMMRQEYFNLRDIKKWLHIVFGICMLISFFLPWVLWQDFAISGFDLPAGNFFGIATSKFGVRNPFPQFNFTFYLFWLIPALVSVAVFQALKNKKKSLPAFIAGHYRLSCQGKTYFIMLLRCFRDTAYTENFTT